MLTKLSFRYAWKKKSRSLIIVVATCLASFLFCSILLISKGLIETIQTDAKYRYGDYTICMSYAEADKQKDFIRQCDGSELITKNLDGYVNWNETVFSVWSVSDNWYNSFKCELSEGRYPNKLNEILVPDNFSIADDFTIENTISADIFVRLEDDGSLLDERNSFSYLETKKIIKSVEFTIVGRYINDGRTSINSNNTLCIYTFEDPSRNEFSFIYSKVTHPILWASLEEQYSLSVFTNKDYLTTIGYSSSGESVLGSIVLLCLLLLVLVAIAIIILIGNAFALSYREQAQELGILSSMGATTLQIKLLFILESLWLSSCGIVFGIALSVGGVFLCISQIPPYILSICYVTTEFVMPSVVMPICLSCGFTIIISLIATLFPIMFTKHPSQIELMRDSFSFCKSKKFDKVCNKKIESFIAERYRLSNLPRFWIMVSSLGLSTIILLLSLGICNAEITASEKEIENVPYDIYFRIDTLNTSEISTFYSQLLNERTVDSDRSYWYTSYSNFAKSELSSIMEKEANVIVIPENKFKKIVKGNEVPDVIASQNTINYLIDGDKIRQESVSLFSTFSFVTVNWQSNKQINVGCIPWQNVCDIYPCFRDVEESILIFPENTNFLTNQTVESGNMFIFADDHKTICESYKADNRLSILDLAADYEQQKTDAIIIKFFLYLFMIIIFFVCFINMFFTIYSNHKLRERDYLVLQTIGMIPKQTRRMVCYECVKSCLLTILIGGSGTVIFSAIIKYIGGFNFSFPLLPMFVVIFLTAFAHFISFITVNKQIMGLNMLEGIRKF